MIIKCRINTFRTLTDILWRVFHILTKPVNPYKCVSVNRRNNEARATGSVKMWKPRHKIFVDIFTALVVGIVS